MPVGVALVEAEDPARPWRLLSGGSDRGVGQRGNRERVGRSHALHVRELLGEGAEWNLLRAVGRHGAHALARRYRGADGARQTLRASDAVDDAVPPAGGDGAEIQAGARRAGRERVGAVMVDQASTVQSRAAGFDAHAGRGCGSNGHLMRGELAAVGNGQYHAVDSGPAGGFYSLAQLHRFPGGALNDALHVDGQGRDRPLRHRGGEPVDEEQDAAEQSHPEPDPEDGGQGAAQVAAQVGEDVPEHHRSCPSSDPGWRW